MICRDGGVAWDNDLDRWLSWRGSFLSQSALFKVLIVVFQVAHLVLCLRRRLQAREPSPFCLEFCDDSNVLRI